MGIDTRPHKPTHVGFEGDDLPEDEDLYRCVHCGLCLSACPTYIETGLETESPRGRIALMKAVKEGRLDLTSRVASHWDLCLQCRACEAVCPSGVPFGRLMERTRSQTGYRTKRSFRQRTIETLFLRGGLPHPTLLRAGGRLLRAYQRWGFRRLLRASQLLKLLPGNLATVETGIPTFSDRFFGPSAQVFPSEGETRMVVGLLSGCVMPLVQGPTMEASVRVLNKNGCDVAVPLRQGCCGALNLHNGDIETARKLAKHNIDVFLDSGLEKIVVASAGCGSAMKEYVDLLKADGAYKEKAQHFSGLTVDITEFLASIPFRQPKGEVRRRVTYQDPCHLAHAQRITQEPRAILGSIPGLELIEMESSSRCCGAAGIYSATQVEMSRQLLEGKMESVAGTGADTIATANPGCMIQLETGLRLSGIPGRVCHVVDLLDEAYQAET